MLACGTADMWNLGNVIGSMLCSRALMETITMAEFIEDTLEKHATEKDIAAVETLANSQLFSTRNPDRIAEGSGFSAKSVLTFIDKFDKKIDGARDAYDFLSEFCHPNGSGHLFTYGDINYADGSVSFSEFPTRHQPILAHVMTGYMLILFVERIMDTFDRLIPLISEIDGATGSSEDARTDDA